jgi:predicted nucleotidyltransferase
MDLRGVKECLARNADLYRHAYLHGSILRGTQDEYSDVDLILIRDTSLPFFDRIREMFDLVAELGRVDLLIYTEAEYQEIVEGPGRYFLKDIFQKGLRIEGNQQRSTAVAATG